MCLKSNCDGILVRKTNNDFVVGEAYLFYLKRRIDYVPAQKSHALQMDITNEWILGNSVETSDRVVLNSVNGCKHCIHNCQKTVEGNKKKRQIAENRKKEVFSIKSGRLGDRKIWNQNKKSDFVRILFATFKRENEAVKTGWENIWKWYLCSEILLF